MSDSNARLSREVIVKLIEAVLPFNRLLGLQVADLGDGRVSIVLPYRDTLLGDVTKPALHGGAIAALLDACGGGAVFTQLDAGDNISTIDILVDYLRPCPAKDVTGHAEVVRLGGRVALVQLKAHPTDDPTHLVASGRATYNIKRGALPFIP